MALRGERVGTAYVRILADGSGLNKSIAKEIKDANSEELMGQAGRTDSKAYGEGFEEQNELISERFVNGLVAGIRRQSGKHDAAIKQLNDGAIKTLESQIRTRFPVVGEQMVANLREGFLRSGGDSDFLDNFVENLSREWATATDQFNREWQNTLREAYADNAAFDAEAAKARRQALTDELNEAYALHRDYEMKVAHQKQIAAKEDKEAAEEEAKQLRRLRDRWAVLTRQVNDYAKGVDQTHGSRRRLLKSIKELNVEFAHGGALTYDYADRFDRLRRSVIDTEPAIFRLEHSLSRFADTSARAFGKGSRNNFLNFIGSMLGNILRIPNMFLDAANAIRRFGTRVFEVGRERGPLAALGTAMGGLIKVATGLTAAIAGTFVLIGPLISLMSQLGGVIVALASSVGYAVMGVIGAIPAIVLPAIAGIAGLALAFYDLDKAQKATLKQDVKPVVDSFKELADTVRIGLFRDLTEQAKEFAGVIDGFRPMFRGIGDALSTMATSWLRSMDSGAFESFRDRMANFLPAAILYLGEITGNVLGGMGGLFAGMIPFMRDVLSYLSGITDEFSDWANSMKGRNEIIDFFEDVKESTADVADFLGSVVDLFGELLSAGKDTGDSLFESMTKAVDGWVAAINKNPDILGNWFKAAEDFGKVFGNVLVGLAKVFSALDNEFSRSAVTFVFEALATAIETVAAALEGLAGLLGIGEDKMLGFVGQAAAALFILPKLTGAVNGMKGAMVGMVGAQATAISRMAALQSAAKTAAGAGGLMLLVDGATRADGALGVLETTLGGAATGWALGGPIGALIGGGLGGLLGIVTAAKRAGDATKDLSTNFDGLRDSLDQVTGAANEATRAALYTSLAESNADVLIGLEQQGLSRRQVIDAMLGEKKALDAVRQALREEQVENRNSQAEIDRLTEKRNELVKSASPDSATYDPNAQDRIDAIDKEIAALEEDIDTRDARADAINDGMALLERERKAIQEQTAAVRELSKNMKFIPEKIEAKIKTTGIIPTTRGVAELAEKYDLLDKKQIRTLIKESGADTTIKAVQRVLDKLRETDAEETIPKIDLDKTRMDEKLKAGRAVLSEFARSVFTPKIDVDNTGAREGITETEQWLAGIQDELVYVNVQRRGGGVQEFTASGGIFSGAQRRIIGEAGPEAVVPLNRRLADVDPAVRWLSAIAQGLAPPGTGSGTPGKIVDVGGITVVTPSADPVAVATETVNQLYANASL